MPRPKKRRRVLGVPPHRKFGPIHKKTNDAQDEIKLSVDEYETIRLIDYENHTQETCAQQMDVSRTTVQAIYERARRKIATSIVMGKSLIIDGGDFVYEQNSVEANHSEPLEPLQYLESQNLPDKPKDTTRVAVSEVENVVCHFGECEVIQVFDICDQTIIDTHVIDRPDIPSGFLPNFLRSHSVDVVIGTDMAQYLKNHFNDESITVYNTEKAYPKDAVSEWILS